MYFFLVGNGKQNILGFNTECEAEINNIEWSHLWEESKKKKKTQKLD